MSKMTAWVTTLGEMTSAKLKRPRFHVAGGEDIGDWLIGAYVRSLMDDHRPSVEGIGNEGSPSPTVTLAADAERCARRAMPV